MMKVAARRTKNEMTSLRAMKTITSSPPVLGRGTAWLRVGTGSLWPSGPDPGVDGVRQPLKRPAIWGDEAS
ncbi:hypothetical protein GCM10023075_49600 [Streptosporangium album]